MKVSLTIGRTINLGNFESLRVDVCAEVNSASSCIVKDVDNLHIELDQALDSVIEKEKKVKR